MYNTATKRCDLKDNLILLLLYTMVIKDVVGGSWTQWSEWGACSRSCDGGLTNQRRRCIDDTISCFGPDVRYQHCNVQSCAFDSRDLEDRICETNNRVPLNGFYYNWVPVSAQKYQCFVLCEDESKNIPNVIQTNMEDGTFCGRNANHYCIQGKCANIGCDGFSGSTNEIDVCGICGGDNSTCRQSKKQIEKRYQWEIRWSPCSVSCGTGYRKSRNVCTDTNSGSDVDDRHCSGLDGFKTITAECSERKCEPRWMLGTWRSCSADCGGGTQTRRVTCSQGSRRGPMLEVPSYRCPDPLPVSQQSCNTQFCPSQWMTGEWNQCSATCGIGIQTRTAHCVKIPLHGVRINVSNMECYSARPLVSRSCSKLPCHSRLSFMPHIETENSTFIQYKRVKRVTLKVGEKAILLARQPVKIKCPVKNFNKRHLFWARNRTRMIPMSKLERVYVSQYGALKIRRTDPALDAGVYTCMAGMESADIVLEFQTKRSAVRKVKDMIRHIETRENLDYLLNRPQNDKIPGQPGPLNLVQEVTSLNRNSARSMFMTGDWSSCSRTCGSGTQTRKVTCSIVSNSFVKIVGDKECLAQSARKPESYRLCVLRPDCPQWVAGPWTECSSRYCKSEGKALQKRALQCQGENGTTLSINVCNGAEKPADRQECPNPDCEAIWRVSRWTKCKPKCSKRGKKTRIIWCVWKLTKKHAHANCRTKARPVVWKRCKPRGCKKGPCTDSSRYCSLVGRLRMCRYSTFKTRCCATCRNSVLY